VAVAGQRWRIEESFQAAEGLVGLDQHQVRRWRSWHRWTTLAILAHAFLAVSTAIEREVQLSPTGLIALTINEFRRLFDALLLVTTTPLPACWPGHDGDDDTNTERGFPIIDAANCRFSICGADGEASAYGFAEFSPGGGGLGGVLPGSVKQLSEPLAGLRCQPQFARVWPGVDLGQCLFAPPLEQQKELAVQRPDPFDEVQPLGKWATGADSVFAEREHADAQVTGLLGGGPHRGAEVLQAAVVGEQDTQQRLDLDSGWSRLGCEPFF
jgi:hypothetical protein